MSDTYPNDPIAPSQVHQGMNKREYLSCHILNGLLSNDAANLLSCDFPEVPEDALRVMLPQVRRAICREAVALADALIAALNEDHE